MLLEMRGIGKSFATIPVLEDVDFQLEAGQIHALLGHNGAGKSTLIKMLGGVFAPQHGSILIDGKPVTLPNPRAANRAGVAVIYQDFSLIPDLTVAENIALGRYPRTSLPFFYSRRKVLERSAQEAAAIGVRLPMLARVRSLGVAQQQMVEIVRAISHHGRILVTDEPTARLAPAERQQLFELMRKLTRAGAGIVFITHFLEEAAEVADKVTVLRNGRVIACRPAKGFSTDAMATMLVGEETTRHAPVSPKARRAEKAVPVLSLRGFSVANRPPIDLDVAAGEIVGIAGLIGSGRTRLMRGIIGDVPAAGTVTLEGRTLHHRAPQRTTQAGITMVPEDRQANGLVLTSSVCDNIALTALRRFLAPSGVVRQKARRDLVRSMIDRFGIRPPSLDKIVGELSGGNAQKVLFARAVAASPRLLILDQPTAGVDVGAKAELHAQIDQMAREGAAILLLSDDLDELLETTDRILVMYGGVLTQVLDTADYDRPSLLTAISTPPRRESKRDAS